MQNDDGVHVTVCWKQLGMRAGGRRGFRQSADPLIRLSRFRLFKYWGIYWCKTDLKTKSVQTVQSIGSGVNQSYPKTCFNFNFPILM